MSDDLVKRLQTSWDADRSIISQTENWMRERQEAADRIKELEAKLALLMDAAESAIGHIERIPPRLATARVELCDALAELKEENRG